MKKHFSLLMASVLLLSLFACGAPATIPNPPLVLGEKYLTDLDYEQALLQFDQAIEIEPKNPRGYLGKADALLHLNRQSDAVSTLADGAKAVRGETRTALKAAQAEAAKSAVDGYMGIAACYEKLGWKEIALALLKRVCEEMPEESRLREALEALMGVSNSTDAPTTSEVVLSEAANLAQGEFIRILDTGMQYKYNCIDGIPQPMGKARMGAHYGNIVEETVMAYMRNNEEVEWEAAAHYWAGLRCTDCPDLPEDGSMPEWYEYDGSHAWSGEWKDEPKKFTID